MRKYKISRCQLIETLSTALELTNPTIAGHNKRVAVLSRELARVMGLSKEEIEDIYFAALLHDVGATPLSVPEKTDLADFDVKNPYKHCLIGYMLLKNYQPFEKIAEIVHYHHASWMNGKNLTNDGRAIPIGSYIIHLADRIDILIRHNQHILLQKKRIVDHIRSKAGDVFAPQVVDALDVLYSNEYFWLATTNNSNSIMEFCAVSGDDEQVTQEELDQFSRLISLVIDFKSRFTASHSSGVAAVSRMLGDIFGLNEYENNELAIAGNLHDLGKLVVPNEILEKNGRLDDEEDAYIKSHSYFTYQILSHIPELGNIATYAAQHHEKVDGTGYPFHIAGTELSVNSKLLAVADVFTALTEDRPYRKGLEKDSVVSIMEQMVQDKHLEASLVMLVNRNFGDIDRCRAEEQNMSLLKYKDFWKTINGTLVTQEPVMGTVI